MPLPKLSPLQSRLAASLIASIMLLMLYFTFSSPHFAYAADVDSIRQEDHNHERLLETPFLDIHSDELDLREARYEAQFQGYDRGIIGRAPTANEPTALTNNVKITTNIPQGMTMQYVFLNSSLYADPSPPPAGLPPAIRVRGSAEEENDEESGEIDHLAEQAEELTERDDQTTLGNNRTLYISANTCVQPGRIVNTTLDPAPQLQLYISQSSNNTTPGPGQDPNEQKMVPLVEGAQVIALNASGDVYIGLHGQNTTDYEGVWSAQIAASIDAPYHTYHNSSPNLYLVDSDSSSALLITKDLTTAPPNSTVYQEWMNLTPPFVVFANRLDDVSIAGVRNSYCGLETYSNIAATRDGVWTGQVQTGMTSRGQDSLPKEQFYFNGLESSSVYNGILAMNGNSTDTGDIVGGGGQVWAMMNFSTASTVNCAVIFNLSFCDQTAYAVPGNPQNFPNLTSLAAFYDNATQAQYQFFQNVLAQIPCETTSSAQYSLARNCNDCAVAYKEWLCSVTIPRCTDFTSTLPWLQARNMGQAFPNGTMLDPSLISLANQSRALNASRNPNIDLFVQPGPYKELLPCDDLCYNIVQSCPSAMGFECPLPGQLGFNQSYGLRPDGTSAQAGQVTCNYPGAAFYLSVGSSVSTQLVWVFIAVTLLSLVFI